MGYNAVNVTTRNARSFSSVYTERLSDSPGKFSEVTKMFSETDIGKSFVESGGNVANYLRAREEFVFLNLMKYFSRMSELPADADGKVVLESNGSKPAYSLSNEEILKFRKGIQSVSYAPLYKPFSLGSLRAYVLNMFENLPDCNRKNYFSRFAQQPFVETESAYKQSGSVLLDYNRSGNGSDGTRYQRYIDYAISRLIKVYEKNYDNLCLSGDFDYIVSYTDPFFDRAQSFLDEISEKSEVAVSQFYAKHGDNMISFYISSDVSGEPAFTYTYGLAGENGYFTYRNDRNEVVRYGKDYDLGGKVIASDSSESFSYHEPSFGAALDQEAYYGADGGRESDSEEPKQGLLSVMSPYISAADARSFARNFNSETVYSRDMAQSLFDSMSWLYAEGYDFSIRSGRRANSSSVELVLNEMPGNQRLIFYPKNGELAVRLESSMYNYEITERPGVSTADSMKLVLRYLRGEFAGETLAVTGGSSKTAIKGESGRGLSSSEVTIKGKDLINAGLAKEDELYPDDEILTFRVFSEYSHFAPRFCYNSYVNGSGAFIEPEGAFRIQMYVVSAMQNFMNTMKFNELSEAVKRISETDNIEEADLSSITGLLSDDPNVSGIQKKYVLDLIDIYGYVNKTGMLSEEDGFETVPVADFAARFRSVDSFNANESYRLSADSFVDALTEQICREQIGEIYDIRNVDRGMLTAVWSDLSDSGQSMSTVVDEFGIYVKPSHVMDIDPEVFRFKDDIAEGEVIDMKSRANCVCNFYPARFNAAGVLTYGHGNTSGVSRTALLAALTQMKYPSDKVFGDGEFSAVMMQRDLLHFDEFSAIRYENCNNDYEKHAMDVCRQALIDNGVLDDIDHPIELAVDNQGIIRWSAYRNAVVGKNIVAQKISGDIGQIPVRDSDVRENGFDSIYHTRFGAGENFIFVPGYSAWLTTDGIYDDTANEENAFHMRDRLRLRGFDDIFDNRIRQTVSKQMVQPYVMDSIATGEKVNGKNVVEKVARIPVGLDSTALNSTYTKDTYGMRLDSDFFDKNRLDLSNDDSVHTRAFIDTMTSKVRFPTTMRDSNTTSAARRYAQSQRYNTDGFSPAERTAFMLSGFQSMRIPRHDIWGGIFDLEMIGSDSNQGLSMYLVDGAKVENGRVIPVEYDEEKDSIPRCAFANMDEFRYIDNDMAGRTRMVSNQLVGAKRIMKDVNICYSTFYGWTFDDAFVISKEFAEKASILDGEANERSLVKGDKLSCFGGNKGVISLIVDRNWTDEDLDRICGDDSYKREIYSKMLKFFRDNPELEAVASPFGPMSRDNASVIMKGLEAKSEGNTPDLIHPDGHVDGSMGKTDLIIPHQTVDEKTTVYDEPGEGRKVSSQLAWAMTAKGATGLISALFKTNDYAWSDLREYFIATGLDVTQDGTIKADGYHPYKVPSSDSLVYTSDESELVDEERTVFMPYVPARGEDGKIAESLGAKQRDAILTSFREELATSGGFFYLPVSFGALPDDVKERAEKLGISTDFAVPSFFGDSSGSASSRKAMPIVKGDDGEEYYRIPVLPPHLRKDSKNLDGRYTTHDFTLQYESMYDASMQWYSYVLSSLEDHENLNDDKFRDELNNARRISNYMTSNFDQIQSTIIQKLNGMGTGKHSYFRDELQGIRIPNSATAVFVPDPTLAIGEVAMDREVMKSLNIRDGESILVWRDPVLRDGALRCVTARFDLSVHGVSMNPFCDYSMDGDFDGDTLGMIKIPEEAKEEAERLFGYGNNLLEIGAEPTVVDGKENSPLYFNFSMDIKTAEAVNPSLVNLREAIEAEANDCLREIREKGVREQDVRKKQDALVERLTDYSRKVYETAGDYMHTIDFSSKESVFDSFRRMALDGSKGSASKLYDLLQYSGWEISDAKTGEQFADKLAKKDSLGEEFDKWFESFKPKVKASDKPFVGYEETEKVHEASSIKTDDTGSAGTKSQKAFAALRERCPDAALNVTYNVTQALLQIKKDPVMAHRMDTLVCTDMATLFSGYKPRCFYADDKTKLEQITTAREFADTFYHLITDKDKMNLSVSMSEVSRLAKGLVMDGKFYAPTDFLERFGSVLDYVSYASDGGEKRCFDMLQTLDGKNFHQTVDGRPAEAASALVPEKISVCRDTSVDYAEQLREQFAGKLGIQMERLNRTANEIKRIRELKEEIKTVSDSYMDGVESGGVSPGKLREMREDIDRKQENLDKLLEAQNKKADTRVFAAAMDDKLPG